MSNKKYNLIRKKITKRNINNYRKFYTIKNIRLAKWKKRLATIHTFTDDLNNTDPTSGTFVDGYLEYRSHLIFFEIFADSEWNKKYRNSSDVVYQSKQRLYRSFRWALHKLSFYLDLNIIDSVCVANVLNFIENWIDNNEIDMIKRGKSMSNKKYTKLITEFKNSWEPVQDVLVQPISSAPKLQASDAISGENSEVDHFDTKQSGDEPIENR